VTSESKYEGAGTTFWTNEKGQRVEINKAFADEHPEVLLAKGWTPRPTKQCQEGLFTREPALLSDGQRSFVGDQTTEYRCELDAEHIHEWHEDGEYRWKAY